MAAPSGIKWGSIVTGSKSTRKGRIGIYAGVTSTNTTVTVNIQVWFWSMYSVDDSNNSYYYNSGSTTATTLVGSKDINHTVSTGDGWSTSNQTKLGEANYTYNKGTSASTKYYAAKFTGIDTLYASSVMTVSTSVTVPALASYKITYNANGGSGAPSAQTKYYGKNITLSSTKPTRTGYTFQGWATSASGSVAYAAGATYSGNAALTLYAVWKANTYTVSYNANGGSGAPSSQTKTYGVNLTLSSTKPTRTNYNFKGWATTPSGSVAYAAGGTYSTNAAITLYAVWELAYTIPRITGLTAIRSNSSGTATESGTYAKVSFSWATDKTVSSIKIEWKRNSDTSWSSATVSASGTSGSVSQTVGGSISADYAYTIRVTVTDASGTNNKSVTINGLVFPIDVLAGGKGVAIGKAAETSNLFEVDFPAQFNKSISLVGKTLLDSSNYTSYCAKASHTHSYLPLSGGTLTGELNSTHNDTAFIHKHPTTGTEVGFGVGSGGSNHGVFSATHSSWLLYASSDTARVKIPLPADIIGSYSTVCSYRFAPTWLGFYTSSADAIAATNRQGWIGHNGTSHFKIKNNVSAGMIYLECSSYLIKYNGNYHDENWTSGAFFPNQAGTALGSNSTATRWYRVYSANSDNVSSDRRLKHDITYIAEMPTFYSDGSNALERIFANLKPSTYIMNADAKERIRIGFVAQDVVEALEKEGLTENDLDLVNHSFWTDEETGEEKDEYGLVYEQFIALNTHMIQKQQAKIESLESEVTSLKDELAELKELVNTLVKSA